MTRKQLSAFILFIAVALAAQAQVTTSEDVTTFYSFGIAGADQAINSGEAGAYADLKNAYSIGANISFKATIDGSDIVVKLSSRGRTGSPYQELQLSPSSAQSFSVSLDSMYGRIPVLGTSMSLPVELYLWAGKYGIGASNVQKVSRYGVESALSMIKINSIANVGVEVAKTLMIGSQISDFGFAAISAQFASSGAFDEGIGILYDSDGSMSTHGKSVIGKFAPQLFASVKATNFVLPFGVASAELAYALNGAGIYSGHSFGASALLNVPIIATTLYIPIGLGGAFYEKNIDVLGGSVGTGMTDSSTGFRDTIRAGLSIGARYTVAYEMEADLSLASSYTYIKHIYRDPLTLIGLSLDGKLTLKGQYFFGAGAVLGTIQNVTWKTRSDVSSMYDDFNHAYSLLQNLGWEAYLGTNIGLKSSVTLGVNNNKGLAMNYGQASMKEGEMKYRQKGTTNAEKVYETFGVYLKATVSM